MGAHGNAVIALFQSGEIPAVPDEYVVRQQFLTKVGKFREKEKEICSSLIHPEAQLL